MELKTSHNMSCNIEPTFTWKLRYHIMCHVISSQILHGNYMEIKISHNVLSAVVMIAI